MNKEIVLNALNSKFKDFEDGLQYFAALSAAEINVIVTRNTKDYKQSKISVLTPESYIKTFKTRAKNFKTKSRLYFSPAPSC